MESLKNQIEVQYKKAFFSKIKEDLGKNPPDTQHIAVIVQELVNGLCKFVPNKPAIHRLIKDDILCETIGLETMPKIINGFIYWIQQFQAPVYDTVTKKWKDDFKNATNYSEFIALFLEEYYQHTEKVYKELWEARKRLANGENIVPPEHRPAITGKNGVPENMRSGLDR
tara:strand:+ start:1944 stop:2453 length:510 start_codon:yes stop_codon:yes gene_type:complete